MLIYNEGIFNNKLFKCGLSRYYGLRKISTPSVQSSTVMSSRQTAAAAAAAAASMRKKSSFMSKPIITVTEFTPGGTPDKVRTIQIVIDSPLRESISGKK